MWIVNVIYLLFIGREFFFFQNLQAQKELERLNVIIGTLKEQVPLINAYN